MSQRCIVIPNGKRVSLGAYAQAWKKVKASDPEAVIYGWQWFDVKARDVLRDMRRGLHDRINQRGARI